jgi:hypothetical protein
LLLGTCALLSAITQLQSPFAMMELGDGRVAALRGEVQEMSLSHLGRRNLHIKGQAELSVHN